MTKDDIRARIEEVGIIPAVKVASSEAARFAAEAVCQGGIPIVEVPMTVAGAIEAIAYLARHLPDVTIGAGCVFDVEAARKCLDAGARFFTTDGLDLEIVDFARKNQAVVFPGALTPTEVITAWKAGPDFVKVFPCGHVGGDSYIRALKTVMPQVPLIAAGGVNQQTAANFILAGASALGVGAELVPAEAIRLKQSERLQELARRFSSYVKSAREQMAKRRAAQNISKA